MPRVQVKQDWEAIKADPVEFATKLLVGPDGSPLMPFEAQEQILRGVNRRTVIDTGRQFGKTTTMGMLVAYKAVTNSNWNICIIASSLEQSRIMFAEVEKLLFQRHACKLPRETDLRRCFRTATASHCGRSGSAPSRTWCILSCEITPCTAACSRGSGSLRDSARRTLARLPKLLPVSTMILRMCIRA